MENELVKILINYGGSATVIGAIIYLVRELNNFKSPSQIGKKLDKIEGNHLHTLQESSDRIEKKVQDSFDTSYKKQNEILDVLNEISRKLDK